MSVSLALILTSLLLTGLMLLGLSLQLGWRRHQVRWTHHALFFGVTASLILTLVLMWRGGHPVWPLLPALALLLSMPMTRPGRANHWQRAVLVAITFMWGAVVTLLSLT